MDPSLQTGKLIGDRLYVNGYVYLKNRVDERGRAHWKCVRYHSEKCKARAMTINSPKVMQVVLRGPEKSKHNHPPSREELDEAMNLAKKKWNPGLRNIAGPSLKEVIATLERSTLRQANLPNLKQSNIPQHNTQNKLLAWSDPRSDLTDNLHLPVIQGRDQLSPSGLAMTKHHQPIIHQVNPLLPLGQVIATLHQTAIPDEPAFEASKKRRVEIQDSSIQDQPPIQMGRRKEGAVAQDENFFYSTRMEDNLHQPEDQPKTKDEPDFEPSRVVVGARPSDSPNGFASETKSEVKELDFDTKSFVHRRFLIAFSEEPIFDKKSIIKVLNVSHNLRCNREFAYISVVKNREKIMSDLKILMEDPTICKIPTQCGNYALYEPGDITARVFCKGQLLPRPL